MCKSTIRKRGIFDNMRWGGIESVVVLFFDKIFFVANFEVKFVCFLIFAKVRRNSQKVVKVGL